MGECYCAQKVSVLVVDDSAFARWALSRKLSADPEIDIVGFGNDGLDALEKIRRLKPDVVTLDLQMPRMDGLTALKRIMSDCPTPVVIVSSHAVEGARPTIEALELGAVDFFLKASAANPAESGIASSDLAARVKQAARIGRSRLKGAVVTGPSDHARKASVLQGGGQIDKVVVIGCSTGGPRALSELVPALPGDIRAAILIVQHMPPGFTQSLANRLDEVSQVEVREARPGDIMRHGLALIAPGDFHMVVRPGGEVSLNQGPPVCNVRPSVDVTMMAAAVTYRAEAVGVILTGMGSDGTMGAAAVKAAGGTVVVEDESTCTVYGMPKSVVDSGNSDRALPLNKIAEEIAQICSRQLVRR